MTKVLFGVVLVYGVFVLGHASYLLFQRPGEWHLWALAGCELLAFAFASRPYRRSGEVDGLFAVLLLNMALLDLLR